MDQIVRARGVRKVYRNGSKVEALRGIDLDIPRGELLAIVGPSGSGKTTLLNCLSGLERIDDGEILVAGENLAAPGDNRRTEYRAKNMGFVFHAFNLLPVLCAAENVELPLLLAGVRRREARARAMDTLDLVGLAERAGHRPGQLSGGEQQRVASPAVAGVTDGVSPGIDLAGSASDLDTRQGASTITLVGFDPGSQEPFGAYILTNGRRTLGRDLSPGDVLLSRVLASKLGAKTGDRIQVSVDTTRPAGAPLVGLRVAGITRPQGPGGYTLGSVVFAPLSTAQRIAGTDLINIVRISAPGGIRDSVAAAHRATPVVERAVGALGSQIPLEVREAKAHEIDSAEGSSVLFRAMLIGMSALVVAVGAALMVNLIGMLAQERRSRLGVLRALGLKRGRLVGLSVTEGALYSLAAGVAGTAIGAAAGRLVAARFGDVFAAYAGSDYDWTYSFSLKASTLVAAFAAGTVLTLAVIFFASRRTSRMTIVAAIRDLPEPPAGTNRRPWVRRARLAIFAAIGLAALVQPYLPRLAEGPP